MKRDTRRYVERAERPVGIEVARLRKRGWSDRSIARHLGLPIDEVRASLGLKIYDRDGREVSQRIAELEAAE